MGNDKLNQKDEEMTTIVSIDENVHENTNNVTTTKEFFSMTHNEYKTVIRSFCTKKSVKPFILTLFVILAAFLLISPIIFFPGYLIYLFPCDSQTPVTICFVAIIIFYIFLLIVEIGILTVLGGLLYVFSWILICLYKYFLLDFQCNYSFTLIKITPK